MKILNLAISGYIFNKKRYEANKRFGPKVNELSEMREFENNLSLKKMKQKYYKHKNLNSKHPVFIRINLKGDSLFQKIRAILALIKNKVNLKASLFQKIREVLYVIKNLKSLIEKITTKTEIHDEIFITLKDDNETVFKKVK